jgi:hypothetical protein
MVVQGLGRWQQLWRHNRNHNHNHILSYKGNLRIQIHRVHRLLYRERQQEWTGLLLPPLRPEEALMPVWLEGGRFGWQLVRLVVRIAGQARPRSGGGMMWGIIFVMLVVRLVQFLPYLFCSSSSLFFVPDFLEAFFVGRCRIARRVDMASISYQIKRWLFFVLSILSHTIYLPWHSFFLHPASSYRAVDTHVLILHPNPLFLHSLPTPNRDRTAPNHHFLDIIANTKHRAVLQTTRDPSAELNEKDCN